MAEGRVNYNLIGKGRRGRPSGRKKIYLEVNEPTVLYITDAKKDKNKNGNPYVILKCDSNSELLLKGVSMKSFLEQVPNLEDIISTRIEVTKVEHRSSKGRKYYTIKVNRE